MAWIESHQSLHKHPKLGRMANTLKITRPQAIGHLHILWWWCIDYAPNGQLYKFSPVQIAEASDWGGDPAEYVKAIEDAGFLDSTEDGLQVHDWLDFCGELVKQRCRRLKEKRRKMRTVLPSKSRHPTGPNRTQPDQPNPTEPHRPHRTGSRADRLQRLEEFTLSEEMRVWGRQEFQVEIPDDVVTEFKNYWRDQTKLRTDWDSTFQNRIRTLVSKGILKTAKSDVWK